MKKILLIFAAGFILSQGLMAQDVNHILNGDFEEQGVWEVAISAGNAGDVTWEYGVLDNVPDAGDGGCMKVSYENMETSLNQMIYQKVILTIGDTYTFSGAFMDAGTDTDVERAWFQIIVWPTVEDKDLTDDLQGGPTSPDNDATILLNHSALKEHFGIGLNTTFAEDVFFDYGDKVGLGDGDGQGDAVVYTVPEVMYRETDELVLGEIGDHIEYYVIFQIGQYVPDGSDINNTVAFTFDEFKLMGPERVVAVENFNSQSTLSAYPNPVNDILNVKNSSRISSLSFQNILGQDLLNIKNVNENQVSVNTSELMNGIYILSVEDEFGKVSTRKILKK